MREKFIDKTSVTKIYYDGISRVQLSDVQAEKRDEFLEKLKMGYFTEIYSEVCPLCVSEKGFIVAEKDRYGLPLTTLICDKCGLVRTYNQLSEGSVGDFYASFYRKLYEGDGYLDDNKIEERFNSLGKYSSDLHLYLTKVLNLQSDSNVIEVGVGGGWNLYPFFLAGFNTYGCDFDVEYLEYGRRKGLNLIEGGVPELVRMGIKGDYVILNQVLEHVHDPISFLKEMRNIVKDEGYLYVTVPGFKGLLYGYGDGNFFSCLQNAHLYFFELYTLREVCKAAGFSFIQGDEFIQALFKKVRNIPEYRYSGKNRGKKVIRRTSMFKYTEVFWEKIFRIINGDSLSSYGKKVSYFLYYLTHPGYFLRKSLVKVKKIL